MIKVPANMMLLVLVLKVSKKMVHVLQLELFVMERAVPHGVGKLTLMI